MRKAQKRNWEKKTSPAYVEEHHIFPVSIFGLNNKILCLTAREHYIAHVLLYKALKRRYGPSHPWAVKMRYAYWCMSNDQVKNRCVNSRLYEKLKEEFSEARSILMSGENNPMWGRTGENSPTWGRTGENNPMWGGKYSEKQKASFARIKHQQGAKNSMYGTIWITNESHSYRISKDDPIPEGYRRGRVIRQCS